MPEFRAEHVSTDVPNIRCSIKLPEQSLNSPRSSKALYVVCSDNKQEDGFLAKC